MQWSQKPAKALPSDQQMADFVARIAALTQAGAAGDLRALNELVTIYKQYKVQTTLSKKGDPNG